MIMKPKIYSSRSMLWILLLLGLPVVSAYAQTTVTGTVTDGTDPLPGVSVLVKGTTQGTQTDLEGKYTLDVPEDAALQFSFLGFVTREIPVAGQTVINVALEEDPQQIGEVVVTEFGMEKDIRKTSYSVQTVQGEDLVRANTANVVNALQGKVAGVMINQGAGGPQSSSRIRIRGNSSLRNNTQPLFVIDGVLIQPGVTGADSWGSNSDFGNIMKDLNSDDFESVTVLKGSAASALYGSQAQNGVVLIKTKKGTARKGLGVEFAQTFTYDDAYKMLDLQNEFGAGYGLEFEDEENGIPMVDRSANGQFYSYGPRFNGETVLDRDGREIKWEAKPDNLLDFYQTGKYINSNLAISGGNENTTFRFSYSRLDNSSVVPNNNLKRNNFGLRATQKISDLIDIDASVNYAVVDALNPIRQGGNDNPLFSMVYYLPRNFDTQYWVKEGNYLDEVNGGRKNPPAFPYGTGSFRDALWRIYQFNNLQTENNFRANVDVTTHITSWLDVLVRGNFNIYNKEFEDKELGNGPGFAGGRYAFGQSKENASRLQVLLTGYKDLTPDLELSFGAGGETQRNLGGRRNYVYTVNGLSDPGQYYIGNSVDPPQSDYENFPKKRLDAIYAYGDLTWKNMLTMNFSLRNDWSSTLTYPDGHGTYTYLYPSVGLSWAFSELLRDEPGFDFLTFGKLRASLGYTGLDTDPYRTSLSFYRYLGVYQGADGDLSRYGYNNRTLGDDNLKNELTREWEFGADLRFFDNRLGLDITYYRKNTFNQILDLALPMESGLGNRQVNAGNIQNQGIEILLNTVPVRTRDFEWNSAFNFSRNRNKIIELIEGVDTYTMELAFGADVSSVARVGSDYGTVITSYAFAEENGKRVLNQDGVFVRSGNYGQGEKELGTMMEKFLLSNINSMTYKNLSLGFQIDSKIGGLMASATHQYGSSNGNLQSTVFGRDKERGGIEWTDSEGNNREDGIIPDGVFQSGVIKTDGNGNQVDVSGKTYQEVYEMGLVDPIPAAQYYENLTQWSTGIREYSVFENSWVALREVSVTYNLPGSLSSRIKMDNLSLSLVGRNLLYFYNSNKDNINPEGIFSNRAGVFAEYGGMPYVRSFGLTLRGSF